MLKNIIGKAGFFLKENERAILLILFLSLLLRGSVHAAQHTLLQRGIAEEVMRFHVVANSDDEKDQEVKYLVRDAILAWMEDSPVLPEGSGRGQDPGSEKEKVRAFLASHLGEIEEIADQVLEEQGMAYRAKAALEMAWFPNRTYGDCTFPAGWYEALRIKLGKAEGKNWWCVLYPGLCFSDSVHAVVEEGQLKKLEEALTVEEYEELLKKPQEWEISFRWF